MSTAFLSTTELVELLHSPYPDDQFAAGVHAAVVPFTVATRRRLVDLVPGSLPIVLIGVGHVDHDPAPQVFDAIVDDDGARADELDAILATIAASPVAATSMAVLLRASAGLPVDEALGAESAVYSLLQSGAEFAAWRTSAAERRSASPTPDAEPPVLASRDGDILQITLNRPARHNAFSRAMRDALAEQLALAVADPSIEQVVISGSGPSFCSGGDLSEFGSFVDPANAHLTRLARSPARLMHRIATRTEVRLHGACMGAGIELAAFAGRVTADPDARIALPEVPLGLIPGAGGTVSVTRRIGRQRCASLALLGRPISAATALAWGLIDAIEPRRTAGG